MKPRFVELQMITGNGGRTKIKVNPNLVAILLPITVPGEINGPDGEKIGKAASAIDFGTGVATPLDYTMQELEAKLTGEDSNVIESDEEDSNVIKSA